MSESINTSGKFYLAHFGKYSMSIYTRIHLHIIRDTTNKYPILVGHFYKKWDTLIFKI